MLYNTLLYALPMLNNKMVVKYFSTKKTSYQIDEQSTFKFAYMASGSLFHHFQLRYPAVFRVEHCLKGFTDNPSSRKIMEQLNSVLLAILTILFSM